MKLDQWIQPGQFSLALPETWEVRELDHVTELVPRRADAAVEISVFKNLHDAPPSSEEASRLVEHFARRSKLRATDELTCHERDFGWQCIGQFLADDCESMPRFWLVCASAGMSRATVASLCCDDIRGMSFEEGKSILKSVELLP